ncbi:MAG TPA: alkaline phosphatase family protein [Chroococcidiopsis sp.]
MKNPVVAIGLDAADPILIEQWMAEGHLKNLNRLRQQGTYCRLANIDYYRAETPWTTFLTGCSPEKVGYWGPVKFYPETYGVEEAGAYEFKEYEPFYALGDRFQVAAFDIPQASLSEKVNGVHVLGWGAHSPMTASHSTPASALAELTAKHGEHPAFLKDFADCRDLRDLQRLKKLLITGITRRAAICQDLLQRQNWDFFLTIFGETHTAGHYMWHLSQPDHPLNVIAQGTSGDALLEIFEAIDTAVGDIVANAPENATVMVFAAHGMGTNVMDLSSMLFLPELMYRYSFPGKVGIAPGTVGTDPGPVNTVCDRKRGWIGEIWNLKAENPLLSLLRAKLPFSVYRKIDNFLNSFNPHLASPHRLEAEGDPMFWQPARWYAPAWKQMKAFALPSYSEGYIRINLKGRESHGIVDPADYDAVCDELIQHLHALTDGRTGKPLVQKVERMREQGIPADRLPDADLVVIWADDVASDVMDSPSFGRIGPVPFHRTGSHRAQGFMVAQGATIEPGSTLAEGHALDLAPTILSLMDAPIPEYFEGKPLLSPSTSTLTPA